MVFYEAIYAKTEEKGFHIQQYFQKGLKPKQIPVEFQLQSTYLRLTTKTNFYK